MNIAIETADALFLHRRPPPPSSRPDLPCRNLDRTRSLLVTVAPPPPLRVRFLSSICEFEARSEFDFWFSLRLTFDLRQSPRCSSSRCRFRKVSIGLNIALRSSVLFG
ncbi:hypothetical protein U1Q18_033829 [Sarracenia purpurea var. burkii]